MELERLSIKDFFDKIETSVYHDELEELIKKINRYKVDNILFRVENNKLREIDNRIRTIVVSSNSDDNEKLKVLKSTVDVLTKAFEKSSPKYLSIFLSINCYLQIDLKDYFDSLKKNRKFNKDELSKNAFILIKNFSFEIKVRKDAPYNEKELFKEYSTGIKELDVKKVYALIDAIERGGRGFYYYALVKGLIHFLFSIDFTLLIRFINRIKHPKEAVFILQAFTPEEVLKISSSKRIRNKWVLIELIRLNSKNYKKNETTLSVSYTLNCLRLLFKINNQLHKQTIIYFHDSGLLNKAFGLQHKDLDSDYIELIISLLPINKYNNFIDKRDKLKEGQEKVLSKIEYEALIKIIFLKWSSFFKSLLHDEEFYLNGLLLTDYANFVVHHYSLMNKKKLTVEIKTVIKQIIWIDSEWHISKSQQITKSYLYLSKLYLLSCAYHHIQIKLKEIDEYRELFLKRKDMIFKNTYNNHENIFREIEENLTI